MFFFRKMGKSYMGVLYKRTIKYSNTLKGMFKIWTQGKDEGWSVWLKTSYKAINFEKKWEYF